jgi:hypothetical protein
VAAVCLSLVGALHLPTKRGGYILYLIYYMTDCGDTSVSWGQVTLLFLRPKRILHTKPQAHNGHLALLGIEPPPAAVPTKVLSVNVYVLHVL